MSDLAAFLIHDTNSYASNSCKSSEVVLAPPLESKLAQAMAPTAATATNPGNADRPESLPLGETATRIRTMVALLHHHGLEIATAAATTITTTIRMVEAEAMAVATVAAAVPRPGSSRTNNSISSPSIKLRARPTGIQDILVMVLMVRLLVWELLPAWRHHLACRMVLPLALLQASTTSAPSSSSMAEEHRRHRLLEMLRLHHRLVTIHRRHLRVISHLHPLLLVLRCGHQKRLPVSSFAIAAT